MVLLAMALLPSCRKTIYLDPVEKPAEEFLQLSDSKVVFDADGGIVVISVATGSSWNVTCDSDWFEVGKMEESLISVKAPANYAGIIRTAEVVVRSECADLAPCRVSVSQRGDGRTDLSAEGTSNCYVAKTCGDYKFNATVKGNGSRFDGKTEYIRTCGIDIRDAVYADLLWECRQDGDKTATFNIIDGAPVYQDGYVKFSTGESEGNALIAVKDVGGNILWSWHIWVTDKPLGDHDHIDSKGNVSAVIMDRNLGALNNEPLDVNNRGMIYEWGRKDPFTPSMSPYPSVDESSINNQGKWNLPNLQLGNGTGTWVYNKTADNLKDMPGNIPFTILNPMTFVLPIGQDYSHWLAVNNSENVTHDGCWGPDKTIFDPCPVGYKVPGANLYGIPGNDTTIQTGGDLGDYDEKWENPNWEWNESHGCGRQWRRTGDFYPMGGQIRWTELDNQSHVWAGGLCCYWTSQETPKADSPSAYTIYFTAHFAQYRVTSKSYSGQIRCVRE